MTDRATAVDLIYAWDADDHGTYDDLADKIAEALAEERRKALTETANKWQYSAWWDMPHSAGPVADRIGAAQFVTEWLRARANAAGPS